MKSKSYQFWSAIQSVADIDVGRYFEYDSDALNLFGKWLSFLREKESKKVLEVGSGPGFFTRILLSLFPKIQLTCLEPDPTFTQTLQDRFGNKIAIIQSDIENLDVSKEIYDATITHAVLHNLADPKIALKQMRKIVKSGGKIIAIEPLPMYRHYYPSNEISTAIEFLDKIDKYKCIERHKELKIPDSVNPWLNQYAQIFEQIGLVDIQCHGWTSIFTISDSRFDFNERKKWLLMRSELFKKTRNEMKKILLQADEDASEIDRNLDIIQKYYKKLNEASREELNHIHEQEIVHRIIIAGTKP